MKKCLLPLRPEIHRSSYLVFGQPLIEDEEIQEVLSTMKSAWLGTGPKVHEFERRIAAYKGVKHAVAVSSCTAGLHLSMLAMKIEPGSEVITTPMTFCATVNAIIHAGGVPVLADIDPKTLNIDPARIEEKITSRTSAILPVHFAGRLCDMDSIRTIACRYGLRVIEDCAHAIETRSINGSAGTFGDCGVLSFYSTKNVVTGEGGMVLTNDDEVANRIKVLALHGMSTDAWKRFSDDGYRHYDVVCVGYKYNMVDLLAAIGLHQIGRVEAYWKRRQTIWQRYNEAFVGLPIGLPPLLPIDSVHALHLYTIQIDPQRAGITRDEMLVWLHRNKIGAGVHYRSIPEHPFYQKRYGWRTEDCPKSAKVGEQTLSLPISPKLTDEDINDVIQVVTGAF